MLIVNMGLPASGKSTLTAALVASGGVTVVSPDAIRGELTGSEEDQSRNSEVFAVAHQRTRENLAAGGIVVFDATNLQQFARATLLGIARELQVGTKLVVFTADLETCLARQGFRTRQVPADVMARMEQDRIRAMGVIEGEGWSEILFVS